MEEVIRILIVEHDPMDLELLNRELKKGLSNYITEVVDTQEAYQAALKKFAPDIILSDYFLPKFDGYSAFQLRKQIAPGVPFIFVSGAIGEENSIELIKDGVTDYALKDKLFTVSTKITRALKEVEANRETEAAKQQLMKNEKYFRSIIENSADGIALFDNNLRIADISPNCKGLTGYSREELLGVALPVLVHPGDVPLIAEAFNTAIEQEGASWMVEYRFETKHGEFVWMEANYISHLHDPDIKAVICNYRNVQDKKTAQQNILNLNNELEDKVKEKTRELSEALEREKETSNLKSRFVSMASHEFRTPLTTVLSSAGLIEQYQQTDDQPKRVRHVGRIRMAVKNMISILDDFLSLDKLEMGKTVVEKDEFNLRQFLKDITEEVDGILKTSQRIDFSYNGTEHVVLDKKLLHNVILNLLSNAIKYSDQDIDLRASVTVEQIIISVTDRGLGIPEEEQKNLFEKFFRAKNVTAIQGTGLGLNIVKRYVALMGGSIGFISTTGAGTTFAVNLPGGDKGN